MQYRFDFDIKKNEKLKAERDICFEDIIYCIKCGLILDILPHPNAEKYPNQQLLVVELNDYAYVAPFEISDGKILLKTVFPSRKATKKYLDKTGEK